MIEDNVYKELLESGLLLDHYFLLCNIKHGRELVDNRRIQGFINLLTKRDYLKDGQLTEKGIDLVQNCIFADKIVVPTASEAKEDEDFGTWVAKVYKACQDRIYYLTRQRQIRSKIDKKSYSYLCNSTDLGKVLYKVIKMYKLDDKDKIERTLIRNIDKCARENNWFPLMKYYILKSGTSDLVTDLQAHIEDDNDIEGFKSTQKFV